LKIEFFTGTELFGMNPKDSGMMALSSSSFLLFHQHLLSINNFITTEFFGQTIDNHQGKELFDES
jgi:hypothetical protein